jgi:hypothetical protein
VHGKDGIHRQAHGQRVHLAVEDFAALGRDFNHVLLLAPGPGQQIPIFDDLKVVELDDQTGHPKKKNAT